MQNVEWMDGWVMDTPQTVMTTRAPAVLKTCFPIFAAFPHLQHFENTLGNKLIVGLVLHGLWQKSRDGARTKCYITRRVLRSSPALFAAGFSSLKVRQEVEYFSQGLSCADNRLSN